MGPKKTNHKHELLIHMAAAGMSNKMMAQELGMTESRISIILSKPENRNKIRLVQQEVWGGDAKQRFQGLVTDAIDVTQEIMMNKQEKGATRLAAASALLDRALGKPQQNLNIDSTSLSDVVDRFEQIAAAKKEEAYQQGAVVDIQKDEHETFLEGFIDADYVVGKRTKVDE